MTTDTRLHELLERWHMLREQGQVLSPEDLCRDCPELLDEISRRLPTLEGGVLSGNAEASAALTATQPAAAEANGEVPPFARLVEGYTLVAELGRGGFGQVWKATGPGGFPVAMKFVRLDQRLAQVELRSLELMQNLRHPHLLSMFGAWQKEDWLIVAMELADGTLFDRLQRCQAAGNLGIPSDELIRYMQEAAKGLDYLNEMSVQHRDIKPANLLLVGGGIKLADFGLAKLLESSVASNTGAMTPAYAAPEFLEGQTSTRSDQYSLAVTYCELRGGRLPFAGNLAQILEGHRSGTPDLSMLPTPAERLAVGRALAKDPAARWPNCQAFVTALHTPQSGSGEAFGQAAVTTPELPLPAATVDEIASLLPANRPAIVRAELVTEQELPYKFEAVKVQPDVRNADPTPVMPVKPRRKKRKKTRREEPRPGILSYLLLPVVVFGEVVRWLLGLLLDILRELPPRATGMITTLMICLVCIFLLWARSTCNQASAYEWQPVAPFKHAARE